ncbi:MAG: YifB family Mg chelatase-like AAA ATPase, partial [Eubacterium sp.]
MSVCKTFSAAIKGVSGVLIKVEADISDGLPVFDMVGLLSSEVKEARERVRTAIKNTGIAFPAKRITVSLSPADLRKSGAYFDLPIAVAILCGIGIIRSSVIENILFVGELGLDGEVIPVNGILPIVMAARNQGIKQCFVPIKNVLEGSIFEDMDIIGIEKLQDAIDILLGKSKPYILHQYSHSSFSDCTESSIDFSEIRGQAVAKRAALIAAAGMHNILLIGMPGSGKSMIARRMPTIMSPMGRDECIDVTCIHSVAGILKNGELLKQRPFRNPHHTITLQALSGGGSTPVPGEITLAHRGILFLDEFPEFSRQAIEMLRQPMENGEIVISRLGGRCHFPAKFMLVAAMNPCPCGYFPNRNKCNCTDYEVSRYMGRISGPILDRIDITAPVLKTKYE